jgi:hypothetical protein
MHTQGLGYRIVKIDQVKRARVNRNATRRLHFRETLCRRYAKEHPIGESVICRHRSCSTGAEAFPLCLAGLPKSIG